MAHNLLAQATIFILQRKIPSNLVDQRTKVMVGKTKDVEATEMIILSLLYLNLEL